MLNQLHHSPHPHTHRCAHTHTHWTLTMKFHMTCTMFKLWQSIDISSCQSISLTPVLFFDIHFDNSLTTDVKTVVKMEVKDVKKFSEIFWRNGTFGILSFDIPRDSRTEPNKLDTRVITLTLTWKTYFFRAFLEGGRFISEDDQDHCPSLCKISAQKDKKHRNESKNHCPSMLFTQRKYGK